MRKKKGREATVGRTSLTCLWEEAHNNAVVLQEAGTVPAAVVFVVAVAAIVVHSYFAAGVPFEESLAAETHGQCSELEAVGCSAATGGSSQVLMKSVRSGRLSPRTERLVVEQQRHLNQDID